MTKSSGFNTIQLNEVKVAFNLQLASWDPGLEILLQEFGRVALTQNTRYVASKCVIDNRGLFRQLPEVRKIPSCRNHTNRVKSWAYLLESLCVILSSDSQSKNNRWLTCLSCHHADEDAVGFVRLTNCKTDQDTVGLSNESQAVKSLVETKIKLEISSSSCYRKIRLTPYLGALLFHSLW